MRYAVISDLHANEQALRHTLDDIARQGADRIVCLGDVVGYGPLPVETVALARRRCDVVLAGNHDDAVSGRGDASSFINLAGDAVERHRDALSREDRAWLASLPYTCELEGAVAAHGDVADPEKFYYVDSPEDAVANFNATDAQLVFVGHTHEPAIFVVGRSGTALRAPAQDFTIEDHKRYIVNPGSVGYPREAGGECHSSYVIYDSSARTVTFRYLPFSVASVMQRGRSPRRRGVFAAVAAAAAVLAVAAVVLLPRGGGEAPALETKTLALEPDATSVRANLKLAKSSAPAVLKVVFRGPDGSALGEVTRTVKQSAASDIAVPQNAASAEFTASKASEGDEVAITGFAPTQARRR